MQSSRFTIALPNFPEPGKFLIYNTISQAQVVIDRELMTALDALPTPPQKEEARTALAQLKKMGFLADSADDDSASLEKHFKRVWDDTSLLRATVLTTYSCNFQCVYCVEEGVKKPVFMDEKMALETAEYLKRKFHEHEARKIAVYFYGGEPLLNMPAIRTVARGLYEFSRVKNVPFTFGFNTNGALFTPETIAELRPLGLNWAAVTIDGPREIHDRNRPFRNGRGSFDTVIANLKAIDGLMHVDINVNFDSESVAQVPALLDYLLEIGLASKIGRLGFTPITPTAKDREGLRPATEADCALMTIENARQLIELRRLGLEKGFNVEVGVQPRACEMVLRQASLIIDPYGDMYGCSALAGRKEFCNGNFREERTDPFKGKELWRRCAQCALAPICGDGCPFGAYIRFGDPLALNCAKEAMDFFVKESLKLSYLKKKLSKASTHPVKA